MISAPHIYSSCGVAFRSNKRLLTPLPVGEDPAVLDLILQDTQIWSSAEWETASPLACEHRRPSAEPVEVRQLGSELLLRIPWAGFLRVGPERILARTLRPDTRLSLEMEFLELALPLWPSAPSLCCFHGAALVLDEAAIMLTAPSGGGKSTLSLALLQRGWGMLSDDLVALQDPGRRAVPIHYFARLRPDTARALLVEDDHRAVNSWYEDGKRVTDVSRWGTVCRTPRPLGAVYVVESLAPDADPTVRAMGRAEALHCMANCQVGMDRRNSRERLLSLAEFVRSVPVRSISVPRRFDRLEATCDLLTRDARNLIMNRNR